MGGVFVKKSGPFLNSQGALCTVSVFFILHFTYLGGAYPTHPLPSGLHSVVGWNLNEQNVQ